VIATPREIVDRIATTEDVIRVGYLHHKYEEQSKIDAYTILIKKLLGSAFTGNVAVATGTKLVDKFYTGDWHAWSHKMAHGIHANGGPLLHMVVVSSPDLGRATADVCNLMLIGPSRKPVCLLTERGFQAIAKVVPTKDRWVSHFVLAGNDTALFEP
jgi:hypothetical protein